MYIDDTFKDIQAFIDKKKEELRIQLRQAQPGNTTLGISCDDLAQLDYVPKHGIVECGLYKNRHCDAYALVNSQDPKTGLVHVTVRGDTNPAICFEYISTGLFIDLYERVPSGVHAVLESLANKYNNK